MIDTSKSALQKVAMSRLNRTYRTDKLDSFGKRGNKETLKEGERRARAEMRDRIEIKDRHYVSTENWLG